MTANMIRTSGAGTPPEATNGKNGGRTDIRKVVHLSNEITGIVKERRTDGH